MVMVNGHHKQYTLYKWVFRMWLDLHIKMHTADTTSTTTSSILCSTVQHVHAIMQSTIDNCFRKLTLLDASVLRLKQQGFTNIEDLMLLTEEDLKRLNLTRPSQEE